MTEDSNSASTETSGATPEESKVRRISNKPARKKAPSSAEKDNTAEQATTPMNAEIGSDAAGIGKTDQKRNNRRRRGKGKPSMLTPDQTRETDPSASEPRGNIPTIAEPDFETEKREKPGSREKPQYKQQPPLPPRRKPDPDKVAKNAWKIYLAEVSEEGVALIGDSDARELARRCFRLSEIFLEEAERRP